VRVLYAVDIPSGNVLAGWRSSPLRPDDTIEWLLQLGNRNFVVTDRASSEISLQDIRQRKNGWQ
jgi:hypothetical protein